MLSIKGFSLLEVLISLILISVTALALLSYQWQSKLILAKWLNHLAELDLSQQHHEQQMIAQQTVVSPR